MTAASTSNLPAALYLTDNEDSCRLLASRPEALLIGFVLDQQITVQKAFDGPRVLLERVGTIDPGELASMPVERLEEAFRAKPAVHRFPGAMARRVHACMRQVTERYAGDAGRVWFEAVDEADLDRRLGELPGFGDGKVFAMKSVLVRRFGLPFHEWESRAPAWGTLGDVDSPDALRTYQQRKREAKAAAKRVKQGS